jgi:WD40 repeat protein
LATEFSFSCACGERFHVRSDQVGRKVRCWTCKRWLEIPAPPEPEAKSNAGGFSTTWEYTDSPAAAATPSVLKRRWLYGGVVLALCLSAGLAWLAVGHYRSSPESPARTAAAPSPEGGTLPKVDPDNVEPAPGEDLVGLDETLRSNPNSVEAHVMRAHIYLKQVRNTQQGMGSACEIRPFEGRDNLFPNSEHKSSTKVFSANKSLAISGGDDGLITLWDNTANKKWRTLSGHKSPVTCLALAPDGRRLLSGSRDHTLRIWDVGTGQELCSLQGNTASVECIAWSADSKLALCGCADGTMRLWDTTAGSPLAAYQAGEAGQGHPVATVAFSSDSRWALSRTAGVNAPARWWCLPLTQDQALADLAAAIEIDGKCKAAYTIRALLHERSVQRNQAIHDWSKVIELEATNAAAYFRRGHLHAALEQYGPAKEDLDRAFQLDPTLSNKP